MTAHGSPVARPANAAAVRELNASLDADLRTLAHTIDASGVPHGDNWTSAQVVAHLAEMSGFFAEELERWLDDPTATIGRTHDHPSRLAAVAPTRVADTSPRTLQADLDRGLRRLAGALERLDDHDLDRATVNVKYGDEPMTAFLDRYILGHKRGHVDQLRTLLGDGR
jgi:hypothetical protein